MPAPHERKPDLARRLAQARALAHLLDDAFRVPGTRRRVGLDPLLGLFPILGDVVGGGVSAWLLWLAARAGAPASVLLRMFINVLVDTLVGTVPVLGDLFDAGWKANSRNVAILQRYVDNPRRTTITSYLLLALLILILAAVVAGCLWLVVTAVRGITQTAG